MMPLSAMANAGSGKLILVVEDERVVAKDLQRTLANMGYFVPATAASGDEALRLVAERCPALVLMDIHIKGETDGVETARLIRAKFDVPVVFLTAYADGETIARAKLAEPHGYLLKPVKGEELRSTVEIALHKHDIERQLRERERWFAATLNSIGDAVISTDAAGLVTFMNPAAEALTRWQSAAAAGSPLGEVVRLRDPSTRSAAASPIASALRGLKVDLGEAELLPREGPERSITHSAAAIVGDGGGVLGAVLVLRDVSERKRLAQNLELTDRLASLGTMATGIAHEVNSPLGATMSNVAFSLDVLREKRPSPPQPWFEEVCEALSDAHEGARRVERIVADLLAFAHPPKGRPARADVNRALEWCLQAIRHELPSGIELISQLSVVPPVRAEEARLRQAFFNLVKNGVEALTAARLGRSLVRVSTRLDADGWISVEIEDTGCGMSPELIKNIFDPFFTTKDVGGGTGLGLAICHGIITSCGGRITVKSQVGHGSTFHVTLPASDSEPPGMKV
jgi:two-component system cell cycle sensor histidine kinase/response regulator CckA